MAFPRFAPPIALPLLLAVGGCAAPAGNPRYPSLLPRAIEARSDAEPVAQNPVATPDPATDAKIATLRTALAGNAAAFATAAAAAERATASARGDRVGGERWIAAQASLADLDALRADTTATLSDIDALALERAAALHPAYPALDALRADAQTAGTDQTARIVALQTQLPGT